MTNVGNEALDLRPNLAVLIGAGGVLALLSAAFLSWPVAIASSVLGILMIAGAEVDARTYLLPDAVTIGATVAGVLAALLIDPIDPWFGPLFDHWFVPWLASASAVARAIGCAAVLALLRSSYARMRGREGLGFGDVKLAAAVGAWLPLDAIPLCFALAASAALLNALFAVLRGETIERATRLPFGAFLCPSLWLVFYAGALPHL
jgi:leader peptidase (prepilin peptidase)/N-methyltransferase